MGRMKNYKQLIKELPSKKVVFAFGRFNPPTTGHELLIKVVKKLASTNNADHAIYASKTQDSKKNPLSVDKKVHYLNLMFPNTKFVAANNEIRTFIEAVKQLNKKYKNLIMVAGSDRVPAYKELLTKYNGKEFNYDTIEVVSAGERDPDADDAAGMSATKMRALAVKGDYKQFKTGLPSSIRDIDGRRLMNDIRQGMGLEIVKEQIKFTVDEVRDKYHKGEIYHVGEFVEVNEQRYEIMDRGSNYLVLVDSTGNMSRKWIQDVTLSDNQIKEDVSVGYAPTEITFKGYTTKNFNKTADAAKAFQDTISRASEKDPVAVLNAIKSTDAYMDINDRHISGEQLTDAEISDWKAAREKAKESLERIGEFEHHRDYWHAHGNELEGLLTNYEKSGQGEMNEELTDKTLRPTDKIKVARIIATMLGVDKVEGTSNPEMLVNTALRKIKTKALNPEGYKILDKMLTLATEVGIDYDTALKPAKLKEASVVKVDTTKDNNIAGSIMSDEDMKKLHGHTIAPNQSDTIRKMKIKHQLGEGKSALDKWKAASAERQKKHDEIERKRKEAAAQGKENMSGSIDRLEKFLNKESAAHDRGHADRWYHRRPDSGHPVGSQEHKDYMDAYSGRHRERLTGVKKFSKTGEVKKEEVNLDESHVEFRLDHREKATGDVKSTFADHEAKVSDQTDKATYVKVPSHKADAFKAAMKSKHGTKVELAEGTVDGHWGHVGSDPDYKPSRPYGKPSAAAIEKIKAKKAKEKSDGSLYKKQTKSDRDKYVSNQLKALKHIGESRNQADKYYDEAEEHKAQAKKHPVGSEQHHYHMSNHYDAMHRYHSDIGQHHEADKAADKAEQHHEKSLQASSKGLAESRGLADKYYRMAQDRKESAEENKDNHEVYHTHMADHHDAMSRYHEEIGQHSLAQAHTDKADIHHEKSMQKPKKGLAEAHKIGDKVEIVKGSGKGTVGHIGEIRYGAYKGAPKTYTVYHGEKDATQVGKEHIRSVKEEVEQPVEMDQTEKNLEDQLMAELELTDEQIDHIVDSAQEDDFIEEYEDDELAVVDDETGEEIPEEECGCMHEEKLMEVLSRSERMRAKVRFAKTKSKRERRAQIAARTHASSATVNKRARRLAIKLMKKRLLRGRDVNKISVGEKERIERVLQKRKAIIGRVAMKLAPRVRAIEKARLSHSKFTKGTPNVAF